VTFGLEGNAITDAELKHLCVGARFMQELEAGNNSITGLTWTVAQVTVLRGKDA
jgi:hypothetical protein